MSHVATATHEVRDTLIWDDHGDSPYWALRSITHKLGGGTTFQTTIDDESIQITLSYSASGISPRPTDNVDQLYEYGIYWTTEDGQRYGGEVKPRFCADEFRQYQPDRAFHDRDKINVPISLGDAVGFQVNAGTYQPPDYYTTMLPKVLLELACEAKSSWNSDYLASVPHEFSTITELEQTVRLTRSESSKLTNSDGIMGRLFFLLAESKGSNVEYTADNTETIGYIHQLRLDNAAASELVPGRRYGFQFKSYHPKHVRTNTEDPLYHPRVSVLFRKNLNSTGGIPWNEWPTLVRELEETMMNILQWANILIQPGPIFVPDDHYDVKESQIEIGFFDDPTPTIECEKETIVSRVLARANDSSWEVAEELVADGEEHYSGFELSMSSAYRALDELEGIVESQAGAFGSSRKRFGKMSRRSSISNAGGRKIWSGGCLRLRTYWMSIRSDSRSVGVRCSSG